jgi:hypothetical protein
MLADGTLNSSVLFRPLHSLSSPRQDKLPLPLEIKLSSFQARRDRSVFTTGTEPG